MADPHRFDDVIQQEDFLDITFPTLVRVLDHCAPHHSNMSLFKAAWRWAVADVAHLQLLPEILKYIKVGQMQSYKVACMVAMSVGDWFFILFLS